MRKILAFTFLIAPMSTPAVAQKVMSYNAPFTQVGSIAVYREGNCLAGTKNFKIKQPPENGVVELREWTRSVRTKDGCAGAGVPSTNIFYKPKTGFRGKDIFVVSYEKFGRGGAYWTDRRFVIVVP